jgi:hypothetical protein
MFVHSPFDANFFNAGRFLAGGGVRGGQFSFSLSVKSLTDAIAEADKSSWNRSSEPSGTARHG